MSLPTSASFLVTEDCNLACSYCFEKHAKKVMSIEVIHKGLEYLCKNSVTDKTNNFSAMIFGGEPFLQPKLVREIFEYGLMLSAKYKSNFSASIVTNGTILTDELEATLREYQNPCNVSLQLSVDGIEEIHDMYRVTQSGAGSFKLVERNIDRFKKIFKDNPHRLTLHGCCNRQSLPFLFENYKFFREVWDIPRIWFMPIHSEDWIVSDVEVYEDNLNKIADYILDQAKTSGEIDEVSNYAPIDRCLSPDARTNAPCGAGKNFVTITAEGEIFVCHNLYFNDPDKETKIGDVWHDVDNDRRNIFLEYGNEDMTCAKEEPDCDAYHCYRCIADNWVKNGSILSQIRGFRCDMSHVERKIQLKVREGLNVLGLLNKDTKDQNCEMGNNPNNPNCLCDLGGPRSSGVAVPSVKTPGKHNNCGCTKPSDETDKDEIIAFALKTILLELAEIKENQTKILLKFQ